MSITVQLEALLLIGPVDSPPNVLGKLPVLQGQTGKVLVRVNHDHLSYIYGYIDVRTDLSYFMG